LQGALLHLPLQLLPWTGAAQLFLWETSLFLSCCPAASALPEPAPMKGVINMTSGGYQAMREVVYTCLTSAYTYCTCRPGMMKAIRKSRLACEDREGKYRHAKSSLAHLHGRNCVLGALENNLLGSLRLLGGGCHGVAILHDLRCCARNFLRYMSALMRGRHKIQLVAQSNRALLQE